MDIEQLINEKFAHLTDVSFGLGLPRMILAAVIVLFGLHAVDPL